MTATPQILLDATVSTAAEWAVTSSSPSLCISTEQRIWSANRLSYADYASSWSTTVRRAPVESPVGAHCDIEVLTPTARPAAARNTGLAGGLHHRLRGSWIPT